MGKYKTVQKSPPLVTLLIPDQTMIKYSWNNKEGHFWGPTLIKSATTSFIHWGGGQIVGREGVTAHCNSRHGLAGSLDYRRQSTYVSRI